MPIFEDSKGLRESTRLTFQWLAGTRHSEPALTMRYTHPDLEDKVRALEALPSIKPHSRNAGGEAIA